MSKAERQGQILFTYSDSENAEEKPEVLKPAPKKIPLKDVVYLDNDSRSFKYFLTGCFDSVVEEEQSSPGLP